MSIFSRKRKHPTRHWRECYRAVTVVRDGGIRFFIKRNVRILNPGAEGVGLAIVKPAFDGEPDAAYLLRGVYPTSSEVADAVRLYGETFGVPREGVWVVPAYRLPGCVDCSAENLAKLEERGATSPWIERDDHGR